MTNAQALAESLKRLAEGGRDAAREFKAELETWSDRDVWFPEAMSWLTDIENGEEIS